jgi:hypothetical protein
MILAENRRADVRVHAMCVMRRSLILGCDRVSGFTTREDRLTTDYNENARRLRNAVEPVAARMYPAVELHGTKG